MAEVLRSCPLGECFCVKRGHPDTRLHKACRNPLHRKAKTCMASTLFTKVLCSLRQLVAFLRPTCRAKTGLCCRHPSNACSTNLSKLLGDINRPPQEDGAAHWPSEATVQPTNTRSPSQHRPDHHIQATHAARRRHILTFIAFHTAHLPPQGFEQAFTSMNVHALAT